ncbi:MAG TPA: PIN domain-containing protein [Terriglobales bacterium]|nr:PIN domain-containing protein [Terriglobales bacterium]
MLQKAFRRKKFSRISNVGVAAERNDCAQRSVVDANILLRAVFGAKVRRILEEYEQHVNFYSPEVCFQDARRYIPDIASRKNLNADLTLSVLDQICEIVESVDASLYEEHELAARERLGTRDPEDWPIAALALLLDLPIWTEDQDFFGTGISTWTTDRVEVFLRKSD